MAMLTAFLQEWALSGLPPCLRARALSASISLVKPDVLLYVLVLHCVLRFLKHQQTVW